MFVKKMSQISLVKVSAGEKTYMQVLISSQEGPNFAMRRFIIEPGGSMPRHTNIVEHEQLVLGGRAEIGIGGQTFNVQKDNVVFIPAGEAHWYKNSGNEPFEFLCMVPNKEDHIEIVGDSVELKK